jgi:hypothetical protein
MEDSKTIKKQVKGSIEKVEKLLEKYNQEKEEKIKKTKTPFTKMG